MRTPLHGILAFTALILNAHTDISQTRMSDKSQTHMSDKDKEHDASSSRTSERRSQPSREVTAPNQTLTAAEAPAAVAVPAKDLGFVRQSSGVKAPLPHDDTQTLRDDVGKIDMLARHLLLLVNDMLVRILLLCVLFVCSLKLYHAP